MGRSRYHNQHNHNYGECDTHNILSHPVRLDAMSKSADPTESGLRLLSLSFEFGDSVQRTS